MLLFTESVLGALANAGHAELGVIICAAGVDWQVQGERAGGDSAPDEIGLGGLKNGVNLSSTCVQPHSASERTPGLVFAEVLRPLNCFLIFLGMLSGCMI